MGVTDKGKMPGKAITNFQRYTINVMYVMLKEEISLNISAAQVTINKVQHFGACGGSLFHEGMGDQDTLGKGPDNILFFIGLLQNFFL